MRKLEVGFTATYIHDYNFSCLMEISKEVALQLVKDKLPDVSLSSNVYITVKDMTCDDNLETGILGNAWLNKLFVIIAENSNKFIAIMNYDQTFYLYEKMK